MNVPGVAVEILSVATFIVTVIAVAIVGRAIASFEEFLFCLSYPRLVGAWCFNYSTFEDSEVQL
ncbi:MAG: hypothetical protein SWX82_32985 [Cyanobacteriota bacterium]|nr:hypothetical protein [Cyanobacteriota bacterium]